MSDELKFYQSLDLRGNRITNVGDGVENTDLITKQQLENSIAGLESGLSYEGTLDLSIEDTQNPLHWKNVMTDGRIGDMYQIAVGGTMIFADESNLELKAGDLIFLNVGVTGVPGTSSKITVIDNSEAADILRVSEIDGVTIESYMDGETRKFRIKDGGVSFAKINADAVETSVEGMTESDIVIPTSKAVKADISAEATARTNADTALQGNIDAEATARANADTALQGNIDTVSANLATEITNRTNADTTLQNNIDAEATARATAVSSEATTRANADTAEATARANADTALQGNIDTVSANLATEITNRTNADTTLQNNIDAEATARATAVSSEATARSNADATLQGNIDAEATARANADTALQSAIDDLGGTLDMQAAYDNSTAVNGEVIIQLAQGKAIKYLDNNDNTYMMIDPDDSNPVTVSMTGTVAVSGDMTISGDLIISGQTTQVDSVVTNSDHIALSPAGADVALTIAPDAGFTGDVVVDIKAVNGGASVLTIDKTTATATISKAKVTGTSEFVGTMSANDITVAETSVLDFGNNVLTNIADGVAADDAASKGQVDAEATARSSADTTLQNNINTVSTNLATEVTNRTDADTALQTSINTVSGNLATEVTNRTNADTALQGAIDAEAIARANADTALQGAIDAIDTDMSAEATARADADTALQGAIDAVEADLATEITNRTNADTTLQGNIDAEATARANADTAEATARADADTALDGRLDVIEGMKDTDGTLAANSDDKYATQKAVKTYVDAFKSVFTITGDGSTTEFTLTHNRNSKMVIIQVSEDATDEVVYPTIKKSSANACVIKFIPAPAVGVTFSVVVYG